MAVQLGLNSDHKPLLVDEQFPDEILGQFGGLREILLVELVVTGHDVGIGFLLGLAEKGRGARKA